MGNDMTTDITTLLIANLGYLMGGMLKMSKDESARLSAAIEYFKAGFANTTLMSQSHGVDPKHAAAAILTALEGIREAQRMIDRGLELGGAPAEARHALKTAMLAQAKPIEDQYAVLEGMLTNGAKDQSALD